MVWRHSNGVTSQQWCDVTAIQMRINRFTVSQEVQTRFSVQLAFAKFLSKIKGNFWGSAVSMILALHYKFPVILDRNLAKANCTENRVCTSCDTVVLGCNAWLFSVRMRRFLVTLDMIYYSCYVYFNFFTNNRKILNMYKDNIFEQKICKCHNNSSKILG